MSLATHNPIVIELTRSETWRGALRALRLSLRAGDIARHTPGVRRSNESIEIKGQLAPLSLPFRVRDSVRRAEL